MIKHVAILIPAFFGAFICQSQIKGSLWDVKEIYTAPMFTSEKDGDVIKMIYDGISYKGHTKKIFAYYSTPGILAGNRENDKKLPAIILVHGGMGTAYRRWVTLWAERGYAAFAMDLRGHDPSGKQIENGFEETTRDMPVYKLYENLDEQFLYQAVADIIKAHNLIRNFKEVDVSKTALCGVSWGAVISLIVSGLDDRFKAVVPIYGCGFFPTSPLQSLQGLSETEKQVWIKQYDPKQYVGKAKMPVLFVNGTNDNNFYLDSYAKTYQLAKNKNLSVQIGMRHSHEDAFKLREPYCFVDSYLKGDKPLPLIGLPSVKNRRTISRVKNGELVKNAYLNYTTDTTSNLMKREWKQAQAQVKRKKIVTPPVPGNATMWFVSCTDERNLITTGDIQFTNNKMF